MGTQDPQGQGAGGSAGNPLGYDVDAAGAEGWTLGVSGRFYLVKHPNQDTDEALRYYITSKAEEGSQLYRDALAESTRRKLTT